MKNKQSNLLFEKIKQQDLRGLNSLLVSFSNLNIVDKETELPLLTYAVEEQWIEGVEALIDAGANVEFYATYEDNALVSAIYSENKKIIEILLRSGANPDAPWCLEIPLLVAIVKENIDIVKRLIEAGANINSQDTEGDTPLMLAVQKNRFDLVKILVEHGANMNIVSRDGSTAWTLATEKGDHKICKYLSSIIVKNKRSK